MKSKSNYKLSHPIYGIWWATSLYGCSKTIGCHQSLIYNNLKRKNVFKEWAIEETNEDINNIPMKYVNATNVFVKNEHMNTIMKMEAVNYQDDDRISLEEQLMKNVSE